MSTRSTGKKIAYGFSIASFVSMAASLMIFIYLLATRGGSDVATASLFAVTVFFLSCGIVLHFMGKPPMYELLPWDHPEKDGKMK